MDRASHGFLALFLILLPLQPTSIPQAVGADLNSDRDALLAFAESLPHGRKLDWNSSALCSSWTGVACSADGSRVTGLRLPGFGLAGPIPRSALAKLDALEVLSFRSNRLVGHIPPEISSLPALRCLHLQNNSLTGPVPTSFFSTDILALDLSFNSFNGPIPTSLENLRQLALLDLRNNSFSGAIPDLDLPRLKRLNLSYNNLSGSIPLPLQRFPSSSFAGNPLLCGAPLAGCSYAASPSSPPSIATGASAIPRRRKPSMRVIIAIGAGGLALLALLAFVFYLCIHKKEEPDGLPKGKGLASVGRGEKAAEQFGSGAQEAEKNKLAFFEGCTYSFDLDDLLRASAEVLGKGSYGTAYRAVLEDGTTVVVKRLKEVAVGKREFEQQMEVVGRMPRHPNVLPLRAYYYSKDEKLMVHDYVSGGSLCNALHRGNGHEGRPLDWEARVRIAAGVAHGIAHVHSAAAGRLIHGNIKSSNVFLAAGTSTACVSDFGLAPLMNAAATSPRNTVGYRAPELVEHRRAPTPKSDVYGFGVLLLEMLTGKAPLKSPGNSDEAMDLPRWVQSVVREEWTAEVFDVELMRQPGVEEEMVQMLQVALACVARLPDQRPDMADAARMVEEVGRQAAADSGNGQSSEDRSKDSNAAPSAEE